MLSPGQTEICNLRLATKLTWTCVDFERKLIKVFHSSVSKHRLVTSLAMPFIAVDAIGNISTAKKIWMALDRVFGIAYRT